ncbi:myogenesis-regulating glycosidase-like [Gigantopelta aegis]|uniref:myogenesis-regulating glycosidase-like n=1 Tax=Gigantopelta aegis TaxID=1735272 RepID=UPI001B88BD4D|nr:myogenesis-regulating glycosidase-like [Gigantopelta aegis]
MAIPKRKILRIVKTSIIILGISLVILVLRSFYTKKPIFAIFKSRFQLGDFYFDYATGLFKFKDDSGDLYLSVRIPDAVQFLPDATCSSTSDDKKLCFQWMGRGKLEIKEAIHDDVRCYNVVWTPKNNGFVPKNCVSLNTALWYGGATHFNHQWPLNNLKIPMQPFISSPISRAEEIGHEVFGSVLERFWISSKGVGIVVDNLVPLHVSVNETISKLLCFKADYQGNVFENPENSPPVLRYSICKAKNVKQIHNYLYKRCFSKPISPPDLKMIEQPLWSTGARFHEQVSQRTVLDMVDGIIKNNFPVGQLEIDDGYYKSMGDFNFNDKKFRNAHQMLGEMKENKFQISTWVSPFVNPDKNSITYAEGLKQGYWVLNSDSKEPAMVLLSGNQSALLDVTNNNAVKWFLENLNKIKKEYRFDTFKFSFGEASFLDYSMNTKEFLHSPCDYTTKYVEMASSFGDSVVVRAGHQSQKYAVFVELGDKHMHWGYDNGLKSIIPTILTLGILGYPFVKPGPIGGYMNTRSKKMQNSTVQLPDSELFIRWMQLATYLPVMEFSILPWQYKDDVLMFAHNLIQLHSNKFAPIIKAAAKESSVTGAPIIRPLWWMAPDDKDALTIDNEFLLGDEILVAPVLENRSRQRDIYLPPGGRWKDVLRQKLYDGGQWLTNYMVALYEIPTFQLIKSPL